MALNLDLSKYLPKFRIIREIKRTIWTASNLTGNCTPEVFEDLLVALGNGSPTPPPDPDRPGHTKWALTATVTITYRGVIKGEGDAVQELPPSTTTAYFATEDDARAFKQTWQSVVDRLGTGDSYLTCNLTQGENGGNGH